MAMMRPGPPMPPPMAGPPSAPALGFDLGSTGPPRPALNRHRGMDHKKHGRGGHMGGLPNGPDFIPAGTTSTGRPPLR